MTRLELANKVAELLNQDEDLAGKVWSKSGHVRVYLSKNSGGKKGWQDKGHATVNPDGSLDLGTDLPFAIQYTPEILAAIKALPAAEAEEMPARPVVAASKPAMVDEDVAQFEESARQLSGAELSRENH